MKITLIVTGKTVSPEVKSICSDYASRISRYAKFEELVIDNGAVKLTVAAKIKQREGELLLKKVSNTDYVVLLDENGKEYTSVEFAKWMEGIFTKGLKNICFVVGGAYGFSDEVYKRANAKVSLSRMTCNHQLIRAVFCEQLYRTFTILNKEPYHHQ
ncbi:MAG: 23S rRNA (pseudouridine(1915)-N(3))-methyltransferase RlmH [Chitinophagales bacterium]|nr:23S rRNA (pseudouridine(1915)-N(3))-methyltransferase RlmH [Chitinophagales bacterium]